MVEQLPRERILQATAGSSFSMVLTEMGTIYAWGSNEHGQLGVPSISMTTQPQRVEALLGKSIVYIQSGAKHSGALSGTGELYMWVRVR
jgi:alpha-tubulin suppressor-like RCC1 family protein